MIFPLEDSLDSIIEWVVGHHINYSHTAGLADAAHPVLGLCVHGRRPVPVHEHNTGRPHQCEPNPCGTDGCDQVVDLPGREIGDNGRRVTTTERGGHTERQSYLLRRLPVGREYHQGFTEGHLLKRWEGSPGLVPGEGSSCG